MPLPIPTSWMIRMAGEAEPTGDAADLCSYVDENQNLFTDENGDQLLG